MQSETQKVCWTPSTNFRTFYHQLSRSIRLKDNSTRTYAHGSHFPQPRLKKTLPCAKCGYFEPSAALREYTKISLLLDYKLQVCFIFLWCTQPVFFSFLVLNNYNLLWREKYFPVVSREDVLPQHIQGISRKCQRDTSQTGVFITCGFCSQHGRITVKGSIQMQTWQIMLNYI